MEMKMIMMMRMELDSTCNKWINLKNMNRVIEPYLEAY